MCMRIHNKDEQNLTSLSDIKKDFLLRMITTMQI